MQTAFCRQTIGDYRFIWILNFIYIDSEHHNFEELLKLQMVAQTSVAHCQHHIDMIRMRIMPSEI